ncbi:MAG: helix-turn-helix domain-containing protein [bacterium]
MEKTKMNPAFLRPGNAARYLGVSARTVRSWQTKGLLPFSRVSKRCVLIAVSDLDAFAAKCRVVAIGE